MQDIKRGRAGAAALVPIIIVGFTCAAQAETAAKPPSVLIFDQKLRNGEVTVEYAYLPTNGYVIVYGADKDGKAIREPLGHVELKAGDHRKFAIKLTTAPPVGESMWAALYVDKDGKPGFDRTADASIWNDKLPVENRFIAR